MALALGPRALASLVLASLVLALVPPSKVSHNIDFKIFQWKCPLQNENGLALSKMKFKGYLRRA